MAELGLQAFEQFFQALWGYPPFAWQRELAGRVLDDTGQDRQPWPDAIALPTASGKTACLDIAVFALAAAARRLPADQPLPMARRIFFVVDRRIIVDEAHERARTLARRLGEAHSGILGAVAGALRELGGSAEPLTAFQLRGGMYRSDAWAHSPAQACLIASTVDQIGSRLLFRAYGRSSKAWPIQAGLAGNDALILLDEAHCAQPFLQTLQAIRKYRSWADAPIATPFQAVVMSATPPAGLADVFRDGSTESRTPGHPLGDRMLAAKPARLEVVAKARGQKAHMELASALVGRAVELVAGRPKACVIFVNRVATARAAHARLNALGLDSVLLTGRMRPVDKDDALAGPLAALASRAATDRQLERPLYVVATQTLEVGADLDFDVLVTECASLDALRQRFGRLDRMGRPISGRDAAGRPLGARAAILIRADQTANSDLDPVYGAALANTWQWLNQKADANGEVDFGVSALEPLLPEGDDLAALNRSPTHAPVMLPAHVDAWAQTAPIPMPSPDPAVFLHGPIPSSADVMVCWRADLDLRDTPEFHTPAAPAVLSLDTLILCPPATAECLPVPIARMRAWLAGAAGVDEGSDLEGTDTVTATEKALYMQRRVIRWRGRDEAVVIKGRANEAGISWMQLDVDGDWRSVPGHRLFRPGDVVVIPADLCDSQALGDLTPGPNKTQPMLDYGDRAFAINRGKALLRLHPAIIDGWPATGATTALRTLAGWAEQRLEEDADAFLRTLRETLGLLSEDETLPRWLRQLALSLARERHFERCVESHPLGGLVLRGTRQLPVGPDREGIDYFTDEDDASSSTSTRPVELHSHLRGVGAQARRFAEACRLPPELVDALGRAGLLHDLGKADPRFQSLLRGGRPAPRGELLAKSLEMPQGRLAFQRAREAAGYPHGARHELLSVSLAESHPELLPTDPDLRDLILHLVASHHGHCRPFAPVVYDASKDTVTLAIKLSDRASPITLMAPLAHGLDRLDSGIAERYWRLIRRHGWWGLAWLEAILRLADHRRSEAEAADAIIEEAGHDAEH